MKSFHRFGNLLGKKIISTKLTILAIHLYFRLSTQQLLLTNTTIYQAKGFFEYIKENNKHQFKVQKTNLIKMSWRKIQITQIATFDKSVITI